jgi:hypothetical protein
MAETKRFVFFTDSGTNLVKGLVLVEVRIAAGDEIVE